jgi:hypothetical protein
MRGRKRGNQEQGIRVGYRQERGEPEIIREWGPAPSKSSVRSLLPTRLPSATEEAGVSLIPVERGVPQSVIANELGISRQEVYRLRST